MKKKCPECGGFGIGASERVDGHTMLIPCDNCDGTGEIFVKFKISRIKGLHNKHLTYLSNPWKVEYPDGDIRFEESFEDAIKRASWTMIKP